MKFLSQDVDRLDLIMGLSTKRVAKLNEKGITTFRQVQDLATDFFTTELGFNSEEEVKELLLRIELYNDKAVFVKELVSLPNPNKVIFFDIEASPFKGRRLFLVSFASGSGEITTFVENKETNILVEINNYLAGMSNKTMISSSGSNWDFSHLLQLMDKRFKYRDNALRTKNGMDLLVQLKGRMVSPVGFSVKKFSAFLGHPNKLDVFTDPRVTPYFEKYKRYVKPGKSGYFMGAVFDDGHYGDDFLQAMIDYNAYDVDALRYIYNKVYNIFKLKKTGKINV